MFGEQVLKGLGAAGWCIGLIAGLGGLLIVAGVMGLVMIRLARLIWPAEDAEKEKEEKYGREDYQSVR